MRKSVKLFLLLIVFALLSAGCGVSREKLAEKGIYTEIYSPELLAKRIETAALKGEESFRVTYYGEISDLEDLADMTWETGYVNNRYVDYIEAEYKEFDEYVIADYKVHLMEKELLDGMPRNGDAIAVHMPDQQGLDNCVTDKMERRTECARYLLDNSSRSEELYDTVNEILYDYQNRSYVYSYMVDNLSWTITSYDDVAELELAPVYRDNVKIPGELPRVSSMTEYVETVSGLWNQNLGAAADVVLEGIFPTEDELFAALMIAEANSALLPCEAEHVSYVKYPGDGERYVISAELDISMTDEEMAPMGRKLRDKVTEAAAEIMAEEDDDEARLRAAYRAVLKAARYDDDIADATKEENITDEMRILRSAYGALVEGNTVCAGYAKAYKAICDYMGIDCMVINGEQDDVGHAWNGVWLDGELYYVDCTYGDTGGGSGYFLFSGEKLEFRDYVIDEEYGLYGLA